MDPLDREVLALRHFEQLSQRRDGQRARHLQEAAASKRYVRALKRLKDDPGQPARRRWRGWLPMSDMPVRRRDPLDELAEEFVGRLPARRAAALTRVRRPPPGAGRPTSATCSRPWS